MAGFSPSNSIRRAAAVFLSQRGYTGVTTRRMQPRGDFQACRDKPRLCFFRLPPRPTGLVSGRRKARSLRTEAASRPLTVCTESLLPRCPNQCWTRTVSQRRRSWTPHMPLRARRLARRQPHWPWSPSLQRRSHCKPPAVHSSHHARAPLHRRAAPPAAAAGRPAQLPPAARRTGARSRRRRRRPLRACLFRSTPLRTDPGRASGWPATQTPRAVKRRARTVLRSRRPRLCRSCPRAPSPPRRSARRRRWRRKQRRDLQQKRSTPRLRPWLMTPPCRRLR